MGRNAILWAALIIAAVAYVTVPTGDNEQHVVGQMKRVVPPSPGQAIGISPPSPAPATPQTIRVIDGDTIGVAGEPNVRLVGCDAPETGGAARCARERDLGNRATARLRELVAQGPVQLVYVRCSCPEGTHGTSRCNFGRNCGRLLIGGRDACSILISEGLARRYVCGPTSCPRRESWCN